MSWLSFKKTENVLHFALDNPEILQCLLENMPLKQAQELMFSHQYSSYSPIRKSFHRPQTFQLFWNLITEEQKLYIAVVKGDLAAVQNLLLSGVNIHTQDQDGQTILIHALNEIHLTKLHNTASNSVEAKTKRTIAQLLIDSGADLNVKDKYGTSPLIFAVRHDDLEMVQSMVEKGAALEACDAHNETALYHAAIKGFADIFVYLLDKQADIHVINDKKNNILMEACASWNIDLVRFLLAKKCFDLGYKNHNGDNALHFALTNESKLQYLLDELPLAQAVNLVFSHEKHNQSVIERSLSYSKSFSLLWDILPPGQSYSRTEPAVLDTLQSLLYSALSKNKADLVQQLVSKVSFDFIKMAQTGLNVFRAVLGNRSLLTLLLEYMPREQAIELMLIPDKWGDTVLYENHDYPESLEPLLMLVPAEGRLKLVKEQKCNRTTTRNYEKSLFDHVFRYAEFLRAMPPSDLPQIVETVFENGNTFFHQTTYNPDSIKIGLEIYPEAERLSKLIRPNEHGSTAFESMGYNPDAIKVLLELLPYKDIVTFIKSANSKGRFNLFTLSNYGSLKLILQFLKPEDRESVLCMQDSNKCSLVYKEKTGELLELLSINKRYQVVCSGLKEALAYYDKNYSHDENTKFVEIIKSLPLEQRWDFLELIESEKKGKAHELLKEHLAELMDLLPPSKRFDALLFTDKANDTVFRGLVYYPEKLKLALEQLTNEQHFNMVCQKTPLTYTLLSANRKNTEAVDIILSGLTPQQQLIVVKESQAADGVFISSIVRKPELLKRILDLYPPEERWQVLITSSRSLGKTPLHKMVKNEESLQVAFNALPDACRGAFLNYRVFGHSVQEFMDKKVDLTLCHYTYRKDIVTLLRQSRKDENLRFFAARPEIKTFRDIIDNDDLNAQKMEMYQLFQSLDFESPFFKNFVEATYPNKMLDKETVLSRFKMNWDMSDEDIMNSKTNRFTSAL